MTTGDRSERCKLGLYRHRVLDDELDILLGDLAAIAIEGAKGVGKTETATRRARTVHALDRESVLNIVKADPDRVTRGTLPIVVDEWQRYPQSWDLVRRAVDAGAQPGSFLLTGSATPRDPGTHSGAGRIVRMRMRPLTLLERELQTPSVSLAELLSGQRPPLEGRTHVDLAGYAEEICRSGFPGIRDLGERARRVQLDGYIDRIIDRDFAEAGLSLRARSPATLRRWMAAYAAATSTDASFEKIRDAATPGERDKPAKTTIATYRDVLERLWILDPLPAWQPTSNHLRRLLASPKHHLVDPSLSARLLDIDTEVLLHPRSNGNGDATMLGRLFESLLALNLRVYAQLAEAHVWHMRTRGGAHEIDFIAGRSTRQVVALEAKLTHDVDDSDVRHLAWLRDQIGHDLLDAVVLTTGKEAYRRRDGVGVVPAVLLGP